MKFHYHKRSRVYLRHLLRLFRPNTGDGIGLVIWRHEMSVVWGPGEE